LNKRKNSIRVTENMSDVPAYANFNLIVTDTK
jgi:hypothetical protein